MRTLLLSMAVLAAPCAAPAVAQPFPAFGGFEARVGAAEPRDARPGFSAAADVDLGSLWHPRLRLTTGVGGFVADVDERDATSPVRGGMNVYAARAALRGDLRAVGRLRPYVLASLGGYLTRAGDVENAAVRERLEGGRVGVGFGAGLAYLWNRVDRASVVAEARHVIAGDVSHWALELGLRYGPRDLPPADSAAAAAREAEAARRARERLLERERQRIEGERRRRPPPDTGRPPPARE